MKNNKGFTLIELLAVIVILGIIITIATLSLSGIKGREKSDNESILSRKVKNAAKLYAAKYYADKIDDNPSFELSNLEKDGLIELENTGCSGNETISIEDASDEDYEFKCN